MTKLPYHFDDTRCRKWNMPLQQPSGKVCDKLNIPFRWRMSGVLSSDSGEYGKINVKIFTFLHEMGLNEMNLTSSNRRLVKSNQNKVLFFKMYIT